MICSNYIHEYDLMDSILNEYYETADEIEAIVSEHEVDTKRMNDMKTLGIYMESHEQYYTESVSSAVTKLGEKIIEIVKKIRDFISEAIKKLTGKTDRQAEIDNHIAKIKKENPEIADKLTVAITPPKANVSSVKELNDYYRSIDELVDKLKKDNVDPKSLKGKINKIKETLVKNKESIAVAGSIIGTAVAVGGLIIQVKRYGSGVKKLEDEGNQISLRAMKTTQKINDTMEIIRKNEQDKQATTKLGILAEVSNNLYGTTSLNISFRERLKNQILQASGATAERFAKMVDRKKGGDERRARNTKSLLDKEESKLNLAKTRESYASKNADSLFNASRNRGSNP